MSKMMWVAGCVVWRCKRNGYLTGKMRDEVIVGGPTPKLLRIPRRRSFLSFGCLPWSLVPAPIHYNYGINMFTFSYFLIDELDFLAL